jgi:2Fe-2S ferredoxin
MPRINVTDREGQAVEIEAPVDVSLMIALRDAGLPVEGTCGGYASCGSCHIYVSQEWRDRLPAPEAMEVDMIALLDESNPDSSRLSCQIIMQDELDGLSIQLAPTQ